MEDYNDDDRGTEHDATEKVSWWPFVLKMAGVILLFNIAMALLAYYIVIPKYFSS